MRSVCPWAVWAVVSLVSPACADGISGTYIGKGPTSAFLIQIVETPGGQLTGRYEQTALQPGGKLNQMIASVTGVSDGQTVVVTIKSNEPFATGITASGTIQGPLLHLSGGGAGGKLDLNLSKSDEAAYQAQVANLTDQARAINEAQARADFLARLNNLTNKMIATSSDAVAQLGKFPPIEQRYQAITNLMNAALIRQQSIYGGGQASVARSQVGVAITQAGIEAANLHNSLQTANRDIGIKIQPIIKDADDLNRRCQPSGAQPDTDLHAACLKFFDAGNQFKQDMEKLGRAFEHTENVWIEERRKQDGIIQASDIASR